MASILQRLVQLGRVHLNDFLGQRWPGASSPPAWESDFETHEHTHDDAFNNSPPPFEAPASASHGLPYSAELARCYQQLDLPFGAPMEQVTKQWKTYLKQYHPDRYANDPTKQADATSITQKLNDAHQKIKAAWERHQR
jgi:DnaJ-class molecular chaperone